MAIIDAGMLPWVEPPGHVRGFSKYLVNDESHGSKCFDFRISRYPAHGKVENHTHDIAEQIYYFISGTGLAQHGDEQSRVGAGDTMFVPPGLVHGVENNGDEDLVFVVVTSPPSEDAPRVSDTAASNSTGTC